MRTRCKLQVESCKLRHNPSVAAEVTRLHNPAKASDLKTSWSLVTSAATDSKA
jgi:hypothetical protein